MRKRRKGLQHHNSNNHNNLPINRGRIDARVGQNLVQVLNVVLCGHENDAQVLGLYHLAEEEEEEGDLLLLVHPQKRHLQFSTDLDVSVQAHEGGVTQAGLGEFHQQLREGGRKEDCLPRLGKFGQDLVQLSGKSTLKQPEGGDCGCVLGESTGSTGLLLEQKRGQTYPPHQTQCTLQISRRGPFQPPSEGNVRGFQRRYE